MIDKTTVGVTAEPAEVEAVLHNLCGYHLAEPDPLFRYTVLTREQVLYDALVAAIKRERARALIDLAATGRTLTQIAHDTNLGSRQRVQRMIAVARAADQAAADLASAEVQAASRQFEQRMAAVEATLDEVVSGIVPVGPADDAVATPTPAVLESAAPTEPDIDRGRVDDPLGPLVIVEPTQALPALLPLTHATKEMPPAEANVPWWRRGRDTGAA